MTCNATASISSAEKARRKAERPFDLAYQAGQVSAASRAAESFTPPESCEDYPAERVLHSEQRAGGMK